MVCGNVCKILNRLRFGEHTSPRLLVLASALTGSGRAVFRFHEVVKRETGRLTNAATLPRD